MVCLLDFVLDRLHWILLICGSRFENARVVCQVDRDSKVVYVAHSGERTVQFIQMTESDDGTEVSLAMLNSFQVTYWAVHTFMRLS
jgi:hypothetical protein